MYVLCCVCRGAFVCLLLSAFVVCVFCLVYVVLLCVWVCCLWVVVYVCIIYGGAVVCLLLYSMYALFKLCVFGCYVVMLLMSFLLFLKRVGG